MTTAQRSVDVLPQRGRKRSARKVPGERPSHEPTPAQAPPGHAPTLVRHSDPLPPSDRRVSPTWLVYLATLGGLALVSAFLPSQRAVWLVLGGGVIALTALGQAVLRGRQGRVDMTRHPLVLLGAGLVLTVMSSMVTLPGTHLAGFVDAVALSAYPFYIAGLVALNASRVREEAVDTLLIAAIVPSVLFAFGWLPLVEAVNNWSHGSSQLAPASWLLLVVDALAVAIVARLAIMFRGRPIAYQMLLGAMACLLGSHVAQAIGVVTSSTPATLGTQSLLLVAFALMAAAALHPSLRRHEGTRPRAVSIGWPHLFMLMGAVLVGPTFVILKYAQRGSWVLLVAIGPAAVSLLVVGHLARMIRERQLLQHLSAHDALTGLPNRSAFHDRLALATGRSTDDAGPTVMFLDLDRFKHVNDTLGHAAGDELLRAVAMRLRECTRADDVVARLAGDEFALLLPATSTIARADDVVRTILAKFAEPFHVAGVALTVSPSIGVAHAPEHGRDVETLLRNADAAMYAAKAGGRNTSRTYTDGLASAGERHLVLEQRLRRSIVAQELVLHYQPRVDATSGRTLGVEALVRWQHPTLGLIPPIAFIGVAESTGFIADLGAWVLNRACDQGAAWWRAGTPLVVSVNVSARQFLLQDVPGIVQAALSRTGLPAEYLELELTESLHLADDGTAAAALQRIDRMGVRCAVDDFGTGYSSIAALRDYPIGVVKLDRSFVQPVGINEDAPLVRGIVHLAKGLGMRVVAEGVETKAQMDFLRGLMCDELQGFLISRAVPAEQIQIVPNQSDYAAALPELAPVLLDVDERRLIELLWVENEKAVNEEDDDNATRLAAVLSVAASVMAVPVVLGVGAGGGLPPVAQAALTSAMQSVGAQPPEALPASWLAKQGSAGTTVTASGAEGSLTRPVDATQSGSSTPRRPDVGSMLASVRAAQRHPTVGPSTGVSPSSAAPQEHQPAAVGPVSSGPATAAPTSAAVPWTTTVPNSTATPPGNGGGQATPPPGNGGGKATVPPGNGGGGKPTTPPGNGGGGKPTTPPGNGGGGKPTTPPGNGGGQPTVPPGNGGGGGKPTTPPGNGGGGKPTVPPGNGGGQPTVPPGNGGGQPTTPPGNGGGQPTVPPGNGGGGGKPTVPPGNGGGGQPTVPPGNGGGKPTTPPGNGGGGQVTVPPGNGGGGKPVVPPGNGGGKP